MFYHVPCISASVGSVVVKTDEQMKSNQLLEDLTVVVSSKCAVTAACSTITNRHALCVVPALFFGFKNILRSY